MKKLLSISLTILLAIVMTYAGSGVNVYSFCCEDCHSYGIEAIANDMCCDIHHNNCSTEQVADDNASCTDAQGHCSLERLDIDLQNDLSKESQTLIAIKQLDLTFTTLLYHLNIIEQDETISGYVSQTQKPPNLSKHIYFTLLETLII